MVFLKRIYKRLISPPLWLIVLNYILTFIYIALDIAFLASDSLGPSYELISYIVYGLSAVHFAYAVFTSIKYARGIYSAISRYLRRNKYTSLFLENFNVRTLVGSALGLFMNIAFAIFNGVLGIIYGSIWYGALSAYHILIALIRGKSVLLYQRLRGAEENKALLGAKSARNSGIALFVLNMALSSAIAQMIFEDKYFDYPDWTVFAYAAFAFYKITMAIINLFKSREQDEILVHTLRYINLIAASVSILALQTALLHTFKDEALNVDLFNTLTGSAVSLISLSLSIFMIIKAEKIIKSEKINGRTK